jgi:hypothetical protein
MKQHYYVKKNTTLPSPMIILKLNVFINPISIHLEQENEIYLTFLKLR